MIWTHQNEQQALRDMPNDNVQDGDYWGTVVSQEVLTSKNGDNFLKLGLKFIAGEGFCYGECVIFNSGNMFFVRKNFWSSCGIPDNFNAAPHQYVGKFVQAKCKVEEYNSPKYGCMKKKLVVLDFIPKGEEPKPFNPFEKDVKTVSVVDETFEDEIPF